MRLMIRIVSGFFMVAIGAGFCMEAHRLDDIVLDVLLVALGICSLGLGAFVLVKNPRKERRPRADIIGGERENRKPQTEDSDR